MIYFVNNHVFRQYFTCRSQLHALSAHSCENYFPPFILENTGVYDGHFEYQNTAFKNKIIFSDSISLIHKKLQAFFGQTVLTLVKTVFPNPHCTRYTKGLWQPF